MTSPVLLRPALPTEVDLLSALALRSKGHWGYSAEFLDVCRAELTLRQSQVGDVTVAEVGASDDGASDDGRWNVAGFVLLDGPAPSGELAMLFVDPPYIGLGIGRTLLDHALAEGRRRGYAEVLLDADPDAAAFYRSQGAEVVGESPSGSVPGRVLPRMRFRLD
ncbi:GNAT family N-acetyltransferase [Nocardioides sp.]|uniref:GNAT family N-acetyltransferase n=1 Tax=Nocardioides sp. TaxID=35761 RepID=UPI00260ACE59|nr:GNAT family N-acetyltransferase [Nocardioides sp.]